MKKSFLILSITSVLLIGSTNKLIAQNGVIFPSLTGETLEGNNVTVPANTKGKYTIIGMAYSKKAEEDLRTWFQPSYDKFIAKKGMFDDQYNIYAYFIPMFVGAGKTLMGASMKKMRKGHNQELFPHILYYKGELEPYEIPLKMKNKEVPYFFVLDKTGKVVYNTSGRFTDEKMEAIEEIIFE